MNAESPTPKIDKASPEATWLAISVSVTTAKISDIAPPATMPAATPAQVLWLSCATANAATAPTAIIPSAPKFNTPDRSVISSPSAVMINGVPATMVAKSIEVTIVSMALLRRLGGASQPVLNEHVRAEQEEQEHPLEHLRDRRRQGQVLLRLLAADVEQRHEQAREENADGIEPADEGDDDRREAVAGAQF